MRDPVLYSALLGPAMLAPSAAALGSITGTVGLTTGAGGGGGGGAYVALAGAFGGGGGADSPHEAFFSTSGA